jgi:hypothetical protein
MNKELNSNYSKNLASDKYFTPKEMNKLARPASAAKKRLEDEQKK